MEQEHNRELRKVQALSQSSALSVVIPKHLAREVGIGKGDYIAVTKEGDKIILEKVY